jgi:hypothetical protein
VHGNEAIAAVPLLLVSVYVPLHVALLIAGITDQEWLVEAEGVLMAIGSAVLVAGELRLKQTTGVTERVSDWDFKT